MICSWLYCNQLAIGGLGSILVKIVLVDFAEVVCKVQVVVGIGSEKSAGQCLSAMFWGMSFLNTTKK